MTVEVVGYRESECSPFPCDENRTCGLTACSPTNGLIPAVEALKNCLKDEFTDTVTVTLTLLDDGVPAYVKELYEAEHPAIPIILLDGRLLPIGRISYERIRDAIRDVQSSGTRGPAGN